MVVQKDFKVLADDKHVEELFMHNLEIFNGTLLPRIVHREGQIRLLPRFEWTRCDPEVHVILDRIGQSGNQGHPTTVALTRTVGADVRIHRADVHFAVGCKWGGVRVSAWTRNLASVLNP